MSHHVELGAMPIPTRIFSIGSLPANRFCQMMNSTETLVSDDLSDEKPRLIACLYHLYLGTGCHCSHSLEPPGIVRRHHDCEHYRWAGESRFLSLTGASG